MRRKVLARSVRTVVEHLESRTLLSSTFNANAGTGTVTGFVYNDVNGNGIFDVGEPVVVNATVTLQEVGVTYPPGTIPTVQSDTNGNFSFTNLGQGQYEVIMVPDPGFVQDAPKALSVTITNNVAVNLAVGETTNVLAGGTGTSTIFGTVFNDVNQDGKYVAVTEDFLSGDTVYLDLNGSGVFQPGDPTAISNNTGQYTFNQVPPGSYLVRVIPRPGFHQDPPGYSQITVYSDQSIQQDIGENNRATISGVVFQDLNGNGIQDPGELPISGETVYLDINMDGVDEPGVQNPSTGLWDANPNTGGTEPSVTTDATGHYTFTGLVPGNYRVVLQSNVNLVPETPGNVDVTLATGQDLTQNLGEAIGSSVSGKVFDDKNANGVLDTGELGLPNQLVYLDINNNGIYDTTGLQTDGYPLVGPSTTYTFTANALIQLDGVTVPLASLQPGDTAQIQLPSGDQSTTIQQIQASDNPVTSQNNPALGIGPAGTITAVDLVNDTVTVRAAELSAVTDALGNFTFAHLGPGTYTMRVITPAGGVPTGPATATHSYTFTLGNNQVVQNDNFGFQTPDLATAIINFPTKATLTNVQKHTLVRVTNVGSLPAIGLAGIDLWAQTNNGPVDTGTAFLIANYRGRAIHLNVGQSRVFNVQFAYPTQLLLNSYFVTAQVVSTVHDNNVSNDFSAPIGPVKVGPPYIDLGLAYATQPALIVDPGQPTSVSLLLTNTGNVTNTGTVSFRFYLSQGPVIEPTDVVVQTITIKNLRLRPGTSRVVHLGLPFPQQTLGFQFINVVVDSGDPLGETNLLNNTAIEPHATRFD